MKVLPIIIALLTLTTISCGQEKRVESTNLIAILDTLSRLDSEPLRMRDSLGRIHGPESEEAQFYQRIFWERQASNTEKIKEILGPENWPDSTLIGPQGNEIICRILQHSDLETREHYIPRMKQAVLDNKLEARWLVRAEDRIATDKGELQIYGGQMKWYPETKTFNVWPVYDPVNIDQRRAKIGLIAIAEHLRNRFDFEWDLDEQIKRSEAFVKEKIGKE